MDGCGVQRAWCVEGGGLWHAGFPISLFVWSSAQPLSLIRRLPRLPNVLLRMSLRRGCPRWTPPPAVVGGFIALTPVLSLQMELPGLGKEGVCSDPTVVQNYGCDPLVHQGGMKLMWGKEIMDALLKINEGGRHAGCWPKLLSCPHALS